MSNIPVADEVASLTDLELILAISRKAIELAGQGEWEKTEQLVRERDSLIYAFFAHESVDDDREKVLESLKEVFELNHRLASLVDYRQQKLREVLKEVQQGKKAVAAYVGY